MFKPILIIITLCVTAPTSAQTGHGATWSGLPAAKPGSGTAASINDMVELTPGLMLAFTGPDAFIYDLYELQATASIPLVDSIPGWPSAWADGISACTEWDSVSCILFHDSSVVWMSLDPLGVPGKPELFGGLPANWKGKVDAAVRWDENSIYLINGAEFLIWDISEDSVGEAIPLSSMVGWPKTWSTVDAVVNLGGLIHFIRGSEILVFDQAAGGFLKGHPLKFASK